MKVFLKRYFIAIVALVFSIISIEAATYTVKSVPNVHVQNSTRYVSNPDGILSPMAQTQADSIISSIWKASTAEVVLVIVDDIDSQSIDDFATELFGYWGIGKSDKDNGLLILIAKDRRKAVIRTGYGLEGIIPDITAGHILRDNMYPHFKRNDYDGGVLEALTQVAILTTDPVAAEELRSKHRNDEKNEVDPFAIYFKFACFITVILFIWFVVKVITTIKEDYFQRYQSLDKMSMPTLFMCFMGLGLPLVVYVPLRLYMKFLRNKKRKCPNCEHVMQRLDEEKDNFYLTPAQDAEEQLNSVDYDVWLCPQCGETDILPYVNKTTNYSECKLCGARACSLVADRVVVDATDYREGKGVKEYYCRSCNRKHGIYYVIPKAAPIIIVGGGGFGGRGGGGFSGGSFGGGMTGGGGASGGW